MSHAHHHPHPKQPDIEDAPLGHHETLVEAIIALMVEKGVFSADDLRRTLEEIDSRSPADGAKLVARSWLDAGFRELMLRDVNAAARTLGIETGGIPIRAIENTPDTHNVIVCTLCSCYPRLLLGASPDWYKSRAYRSRVVREPRAVLAEFGLTLPDSIGIAVHDATAELRYLVVPMRPQGTESWSEEQLAGIVTRDCMIGVALPRAS